MLLLGPNSNAGDAINLGAVMPRVNVPITLTGNRTLTIADSGLHFFYNGSSTITLTFPDSLPSGFFCKVSLASATGRVNFSKGSRLSYGNASREALIFQWDVADVYLSTDNGNPIFLPVYNLALPVLYAENTAAESRNATTLSAIAGLSIPMEAGGAYEVRALIPYTCGVTTNSLRIGTLAWPAGATGQFEISIWNAASAGTAPRTNHYWTSSAAAVTGTSGSASVVGSTMLATVTGRIKLSTTAGSFSMTAGSQAATGAVSIAAGAASMSASKVFDQGRT